MFYNQYMRVFAGRSNVAGDTPDNTPLLSRLECLREVVYQCFNSDGQRNTHLFNIGLKAGLKETILHLLCAKLCVELTEKQLTLVNALVLMIANSMGPGGSGPTKGEPLFVATGGVPATISDWKKHYVRGSDALVELLPSQAQNVQRLTHHAVVDPISAVEHLLASGVTLADYTCLGTGGASAADSEVNREVQALAAQHNAMPVGIQLFSDGFRTNAVTQNRGSAWTLELFCSPPGRLRRRQSHSYILALGPSSADHAEVFEYVLPRLALLKVPRLCLVGAVGRAVPSLVVLTCYSADLPERASILNCYTFKSNSHKRFGHIMYIPRGDWLDFRLHSCPTCFLRRLVRLGLLAPVPGLDYECQFCSDWDFYRPRNSRRMIETDYPTTLDRDSPPCPPGREVGEEQPLMKPIRLTYDVLSMSCTVAHHNYSNKTWTQDIAKCYMKHCGVNGKLQSLVCESAKANHSRLLPAAHRGARREYRVPQIPLQLPALLTDQPIDIRCFIESVEHLLFEGLHSDVLDFLLPNVLKLKQMKKKGMVGYNNFLQEVGTHNLSWLWVYPLAESTKSDGTSEKTYSTSGWTASNHVSSARLLTVGFSHVRDLLPQSAQSDAAFMVKFDLAEATLQVFNGLAARVMQPDSTSAVTCQDIDEYAKLYLSLVLRLSELNESEKNKYPFRGGNCLCLLNLAGQRARHGSPRDSDTWDGDYERGIQMAKQNLTTNVRMTPKFFETKLKKSTQEKTLDVLFDEVVSLTEPVAGVKVKIGQRSRVGGNPKVYPNLDELRESVARTESLHGVLFSEGGQTKAAFLVGGANGESVDVHLAEFLEEGGTTSNGCWFSPVTVRPGPPATFLPKHEALSLSRVGFFSKPTLTHNSDPDMADQPERPVGRYVTTDSWLVRSSSGHFSLPTPDRSLLERVLKQWPS